MASKARGIKNAWLPLLFLLAMSPHPAAAAANNDPCRLLTSSEVEAVIGPLAGPPFRAAGATPTAKGEDCRYEIAAGRSLRVNVTWDGGAQLIGMMGGMASALNSAGLAELKLSNGATVAGEWDKAHVSQCCEFSALRGDRLVTVDVAGSHATITQAASLAAAALKRLDQPLAISGTDGIKEAEMRAAQRPKRRSVCALVSRADAEAIVGKPLLSVPRGNDEACTYEWPLDAAGSPYSMKLMVQWADGFHEMRQVGSIIGQASSMIGLGAPTGQASSKADSAPWDEFSRSIVGVMAVKSDVLVSIESGPFQQDVAKAFVEKAIISLTNETNPR